jgi:CelD/BcsL family acetyltransferase involved in cellulose biosynthesis
MTALPAVLPLKFQLGARTLAAIPRRLVRVPLSLADVLASRVPVLPPPAVGTDGYLVTSLPADRLGDVAAAGLLAHVRQRYTRYFVDLGAGEAAWLAALSANTRSGLKRKAKKLAAVPGYAIRRYREPDEIAAFHPLARAVSATTYQERLLDAGLPSDPAALLRLAAADCLRAWLLEADGRPIAYLCCSAEGETLRYDHVGHDPAYSALSPGTVLQVEAMRDLFDEGRFARFDFTEGEGQHKRQLATDGVACLDLLLLRRTLANRAALAALGGFDASMAWAKRAASHPRIAAVARRVRR